MDRALERLIEILPPPENPTGRQVDWAKFEPVLGFQYPTTFKEFIAVYGASIFLDNYTHFYPGGDTVHDVQDFFETASSKLSVLVDYDLYDEEYNDINNIGIPVYPEPGGLFPFMADYSGNEYFWQTENADSDKWPIVCWRIGVLEKLKFQSLPELFLADIDHWLAEGSHRVRVDRWIEPTPPPLSDSENDNPMAAFESAIEVGHKSLLTKASSVRARMEQRAGKDLQK